MLKTLNQSNYRLKIRDLAIMPSWGLLSEGSVKECLILNNLAMISGFLNLRTSEILKTKRDIQ